MAARILILMAAVLGSPVPAVGGPEAEEASTAGPANWRQEMDYRSAIRSYYQAFRERDRATLERLLAPDLRFVSPFGVHDDRDRMLDEIWPAVGRSWAIDLHIYGDGPDFMVHYRHEGEGAGAGRMAEYIRFEGDRIAEIEVFVGRR